MHSSSRCAANSCGAAVPRGAGRMELGAVPAHQHRDAAPNRRALPPRATSRKISHGKWQPHLDKHPGNPANLYTEPFHGHSPVTRASRFALLPNRALGASRDRAGLSLLGTDTAGPGATPHGPGLQTFTSPRISLTQLFHSCRTALSPSPLSQFPPQVLPGQWVTPVGTGRAPPE